MKRLIPLMLAAFRAFANIVDSAYVVTPPVTDTQCPAIQPGLANPCYYVAIGEYTDTLSIHRDRHAALFARGRRQPLAQMHCKRARASVLHGVQHDPQRSGD